MKMVRLTQDTGPSLTGIAGAGLKATIETIDNRGDFKTFMQHYVYARGSAIKGPRREGPADEGFVR